MAKKVFFLQKKDKESRKKCEI